MRLGPWCPVLFVFVSIVCVGGAGNFRGADSVEIVSRSGLRGNCFHAAHSVEIVSRGGLRGRCFHGADSMEVLSRSSLREYLCLSTTLCSEL